MATLSEALAVAREHHQAGRLAAAEEIYRRILAAAAEDLDAGFGLAVVLLQQGRPAEARAILRRVLQLVPQNVAALNALGLAEKALGDLSAAIAAYRQALQLDPDFAEAHNNLGLALTAAGEPVEAAACYRQALRRMPRSAEILSNLGQALHGQGQAEEAIGCFHQALALRPDLAGIHNNLGNVFRDQARFDEAAAAYRQALQLEPRLTEARGNLGVVLKDVGRLAEAAACLREALQMQPASPQIHSSLVYLLNLSPDCDVRTIYEECCRWNRQHAEPLARCVAPHVNDPAPDRRLRIGYVSPDFAAHPVGRFLLPLLESHDHAALEIYCYSSGRIRDALTARLRAQADVWRDVQRLSDQQLAAMIRDDRIDVLVDLTMHMAHSRLLVFARKPAPVQVTYLAYAGTTGLTAIDYRLSDPYLDPPTGDLTAYSEATFRLPETYWCYRPPEDDLPARRAPRRPDEAVTFGCLNNLAKMSDPALTVWARLLREVPHSRLLLHSPAGSPRDRLSRFFAEHGIGVERIALADFAPQHDYFQLYQQIDVALDPFPYGGGTTTCDALWMGVPVVSLRGPTAVGRAGFSLLSNVGLPNLVAGNADQYVQIAAGLAADRPRLEELRAALRRRMQASPLMDAPRFARNVEAAYRQMWRRWCEVGKIERS